MEKRWTEAIMKRCFSRKRNKQRWNNDKCRCECKELIDKGICDKGFIWNSIIVNVINQAMLENNYIMKIVNLEKIS